MEEQLYIFVMERGFVIIGLAEQNKNDFLFWNLTKCGTVRRWGTSAGLGELASKGPLPNTQIDREPDGTEISKKACYRRIPCDMKAWKKWLNS